MSHYSKPYQHPLFWFLIYLTIHLVIRLSFSQTLQLDDAEQLRHAQHLALGYPIPQPPLYSWLSWGMFQIFGTGLFALTLLKYLLIALTFWTLWLSSGYLFQHFQTRHLAILSLLLLPSFGWHMHQGFTHTILLGVAITTTLHALLRLELHQQPRDFLYLGVALGVGLMAKYSFLLLMIPLLLAALTIPAYRRQLLQPQALLVVVALLAVTLPHLLWLSQHSSEVFPAIDQKLQIQSGNAAVERLYSLGHFVIAALAFVSPWILLVAPLSFRRFSLHRNRKPAAQLLSRYYLVVCLSVIVLSLFLTMPHFKVRWFHPLMMLFPLWWLMMVERDEPLSKTVWKWISTATLVVTLLVVIVRLLQFTIGPDLGHYSRVNRPIMESLQQLPAIPSDTLLFTQDAFLGAHLLAHYPNNPISIHGNHYREEPFRQQHSECLIIWDNDDLFDSTPAEIEPQTIHHINSKIAELTYTLFWATVPIERCR
ncbi:MAG: hypothetical protein HOK69_10985 [Gammaproteobacteria bacterium]|nr:hypothetical protein [Gammaproteobacteria bacterium]MBT6651487.1 hypothetical protein [Gammaproteobacteria bacterium]